MLGFRYSSILTLLAYAFLMVLQFHFQLQNYYQKVALVKEQIRIDYRKAMDNARDKVKIVWEQKIETLGKRALQSVEEQKPNFPAAIRGFLSSHPEIKDLMLRTSDHIYFKQWDRSYARFAPIAGQTKIMEDPSFRDAHYFEFKKQEYNQALFLYEKLWFDNPNNYLASNGLARTLIKNSQLERAEKIYKQLYFDNPDIEEDEHGGEELPLGLIAGLRLMEIYEKSVRWEEYKNFGLDLFKNLASGEFPLSATLREKYENQLRNTLQPFDSNPVFKQQFADIALQAPRTREALQKVNYVRRHATAYFSQRSSSIQWLPWADDSTLPHPESAEQFLFTAGNSEYALFFWCDRELFFKDLLFLPLSEALGKDHLEIKFKGPDQTNAASDLKSWERIDLGPYVLKINSSMGLNESARLLSNKLLHGMLLQLIVFSFLLTLLVFIVYRQIALAEHRSDFVSHVSHELKTPITSLRVFIDVLKSSKNLAEDKRLEFLNIMRQETERLTRLIQNLLDITRLERKKNRLASIPLTTFWKKTLYLLHSSWPLRKIENEFQCHPAVHIFADRDMLTQVMVNLFDNANKFSPSDKPIRLQCNEQGDEVVIKVRDYGKGMSVEEQKRVFKKFYQLKSEIDKEFRGIGLGLTLVKQIINMHNGRMLMTSQPGTGTEFIIYLKKSRREINDHEEIAVT
jgi:signal transduction histidine kinase